MQKTTLFLLILFIFSCKEAQKQESDINVTTPEETQMQDDPYPTALRQVFEVHGGLAEWRKQRYLSYEMPKKSGVETHTIDLYSRKDLVETTNYKMGFDGEEVWLLDPDGKYKGDPVFYHNLMFYFYAMPFVLADDGIQYFETKAVSYQGKEYPGIGIRYEAGIGTSPEDEYYLHFDPDTQKMAWLGYTVTYRTGEPSDDIHWIRYDDWTTVSELILPKSITWHKVDAGKIGDPRNTVDFEHIEISKTPVDHSMFSKPKGAEVRKPVNQK